MKAKDKPEEKSESKTEDKTEEKSDESSASPAVPAAIEVEESDEGEFSNFSKKSIFGNLRFFLISAFFRGSI